MAEHHLGMALGILSRDDNRQAVTVNEVEGLLRSLAAIALGEPAQRAPVRQAVTRDRCHGRVIGAHGAVVRCDRYAVDGERYCGSCATRWQG